RSLRCTRPEWARGERRVLLARGGLPLLSAGRFALPRRGPLLRAPGALLPGRFLRRSFPGRHLAPRAARLREPDRDRLLPARHLLARAPAPERPPLALVHRLLALLPGLPAALRHPIPPPALRG